MDNCNTNNLYIISFTAGADSGLALVSASLPSSAVSILKNTGRYNGTPDDYKIIQCRSIGLASDMHSELLLESYVNALVAYDVISNAIRKYIGPKGDNGKSAYEIAVENGYSGTEEEWIKSLVSPNAVLYIEQSLTEEEKECARNNIGAGTDPEAVKYIQQTLTDAQKAQARANIDADSSTPALPGASEINLLPTVNYTAQSLTSEQQAQARQNIGAGTSDFTGDYRDLSNKPEIPEATAISTNIKSDKNANAKAAGAKAVYDEVHPPVETVRYSWGMSPNVFYNLGELSGNVVFLFATPEDNTIVNHYYFTFDTGNTPPTVTWPVEITDWFGMAAPTIVANHHYEISVINGVAAYLEV